MDSIFAKYAAYYDLLYHTKDYAGEVDYVERAIRRWVPRARTILELGSGTGRHGHLLAGRGFDVHGVERSADMVAVARQTTSEGPGSFICSTDDIRTVVVDRTFDAAVALFHVISYQTTNEELLAVFSTAARHLRDGGLFLFDVWHGPAVLIDRPIERVKEAADEYRRVRRTSRPVFDSNSGTVSVRFDFECEDPIGSAPEHFSEQHLMRYLFPTEIDLLARASGLSVLDAKEFVTGSPPSVSTWSVGYVLGKNT